MQLISLVEISKIFNQRRSKVLWFTGLSGAGKTTIAEGTYEYLIKKGIRVKILDGDKIRSEMHYNLGFTKEDIEENNEKNIEPGKILTNDKSGTVVKAGEDSVRLIKMEPMVKIQPGSYL